MSNRTTRMGRRALLRGAASTIIGLPLLEAMHAPREAHAQAMAPMRRLLACRPTSARCRVCSPHRTTDYHSYARMSVLTGARHGFGAKYTPMGATVDQVVAECS